MHRVDAEQACGVTVTPVEDDVALDGIDEFLTVLVGGPWWDDPDEQTEHPVDAVVQVRAGERAWTLDLSRTAAVVTRGAVGDPELVINSSAHALYLWMWGRGDASELALDGRKELVDGLAGRFAEAAA